MIRVYREDGGWREGLHLQLSVVSEAWDRPLYTPHEGLNLANQKSPKLGVFGPKLD